MSDIISFVENLKEKLKRRPKIGFVYAGISNLSLIKKLSFYKDAIVSFRCKSPKEIVQVRKIIPEIKVFYRENMLSNIEEDVVFLPPSLRRDSECAKIFNSNGCFLTSDAELFFFNAKENIFSVTGSDGKSTVTKLTSLLMDTDEKRAYPCGNIGIPFSDVSSYDNCSYVCELSSFQLMYMKPESKRALITNISENHLNWHKNYEEYKKAKFNIFDNCHQIILNADDIETESVLRKRELFSVFSTVKTYRELKEKYYSQHFIYIDGGYLCKDSERMIEIDKIKRKEDYNIKNIMSALSLADGYYSKEKLTRILSCYEGLPHRCEYFLKSNGITYIDSSIDTTPKRTATTLMSLKKTVKIILGGKGKGLSLTPLLFPLHLYAKEIVIYGDDAKRYLDFLSSSDLTRNIPMSIFSKFDDAFFKIYATLEKGDTLILSPSATAFGEFENYMERGNYFKNKVKYLQ